MTIEEIEARLDVGCATDDDMAYLLDRVRKLERAHAWFSGNSQTWAHGCCDHCNQPVDCADDCEWVKAKELRL